jgi:hypothetical protein
VLRSLAFLIFLGFLSKPIGLFASPLVQENPEAEIKRLREAALKGLMVEIEADQIHYSEDTNLYEAVGDAKVYLPGKDATLYADKITFDSSKKLIEGFGNLRLINEKNVLWGTYACFGSEDYKYSVTDPKFFVQGLRLKARKADSQYIENAKEKKEKNTIHFQEGVLALDKPIKIFYPGNVQDTRYMMDRVFVNRTMELDWDDLPEESTLKYSAKEIIYDDTKKLNNLQIKGARVWLTKNFSIPFPLHINTTVGEYSETKFRGFVIGNSERLGGFSLGPRFFKAYDYGVWGLAPIFQIGNDGVGGGGILSFHRPGDTTAIMGGYGSLDNRFIVNAHQELPYGFNLNFLVNQNKSGSVFGMSQVGLLAEVLHRARIKAPFIDRRGLRLNTSVGWAQDNKDLFSLERLLTLSETRGDKGEIDGNESGFRAETSTDFYTKPFLRLGNELYNMSLSARGLSSLRFYGTGDIYALGRVGPSMEARFNRLSFEIAYLISGEVGETPFLFDQYVDGKQALVFDGDFTINKWFSFGTYLSYNIDDDRFTRNQVRTEFGAEDFKLRLSYDPIRNQLDIGFNVNYGEPLKFDTMKVNI